MGTYELTNNLAAGVVCNYRFRPRPIPFPHGYPPPNEDHEDNEFLLRCFPQPWLRDGDIAFNTPPQRTLKNVSLVDETTHIVDDVDPTKRFKFQVENVSPGTTREITIPDEDFEIITPSSTTTLTFKDITGITNSVGATQLETGGPPVNIVGSAPPAAGYALISTSATSASWQIPGGGMAGKISYVLNNDKFVAVTTSYTCIGTFSWSQIRNVSYANGVVILHTTIVDRNLDVRLRNITNGMDLGSLAGISSTGVYTFTILLPTANSTLELQIRKNTTGGTSPMVEGVSLEFDQ
jgi:hypothetical protein